MIYVDMIYVKLQPSYSDDLLELSCFAMKPVSSQGATISSKPDVVYLGF